MTNDLKPLDQHCIARWVYTRKEWRSFARWHAKNRGVLNYIWHFFFQQHRHIGFVEFTEQSVQIGKRQQIFKSPELKLSRVDIDEKSNMNIMNITYLVLDKENAVKEIHLPIPKGKLKEAIEVQERLLRMS